MELELSNCGQASQSRHLSRQQLDFGSLSEPVHFIGIGGIGMSALARLILAQGARVSGSDREENQIVRELAGMGAHITIGHRSDNIDGVGTVIVSTAIQPDNPELIEARARSLPIWHRSHLLSYLCAGSKLIAVSGTHGKTTTTAMIAQVLMDAGLDPSTVVGGVFRHIGSNARSGSGEYFVAEADESDGTHADMQSYIAVITNIEADHLENYPGGIEQIRDNMVSFANNSSIATLICQDDLGCRLIRPRIAGRVITYGAASTSPDADYTFESLPGSVLRVLQGKRELGTIELAVPGDHNKVNALAAVAIAVELGVDFTTIKQALSAFRGVARRFELIGRERGITVIDDYAHHPTEIVATLQAAAQLKTQAGKPGDDPFSCSGRIVAVFQPHQPGRLRDLWEEFCGAFQQADLLLVCDVYIARGTPIEGITGERFAHAVHHRNAHNLAGKALELPAKILPYLQPGDLVLTIGAGDITKVGPEIVRLLQQGSSHGRDT